MSDSFCCVHHHLLLSPSLVFPSMNSEHWQATHEQTFSVIHFTDRQQNFVSSASRGRFVMTVVALHDGEHPLQLFSPDMMFWVTEMLH